MCGDCVVALCFLRSIVADHRSGNFMRPWRKDEANCCWMWPLFRFFAMDHHHRSLQATALFVIFLPTLFYIELLSFFFRFRFLQIFCPRSLYLPPLFIDPTPNNNNKKLFSSGLYTTRFSTCSSNSHGDWIIIARLDTPSTKK